MSDIDKPHPNRSRCQCRYYGEGNWGICVACGLLYKLDTLQARIDKVQDAMEVMRTERDDARRERDEAIQQWEHGAGVVMDVQAEALILSRALEQSSNSANHGETCRYDFDGDWDNCGCPIGIARNALTTTLQTTQVVEDIRAVVQQLACLQMSHSHLAGDPKRIRRLHTLVGKTHMRTALIRKMDAS